MRSMLENQNEPSHHHRHGGLVPLLAAAAASALVIAGAYALPSRDSSPGGDKNPGRSIQPAHPRTTASSPSPTTQTSKPTTAPRTTAPLNPSAASHLMSHPAPAYARCVHVTETTYRQRGEPVPAGLVGRIAITNGTLTTVVVSNGTDAYTCNIAPDKAVSAPSPDAPVTQPDQTTFAFAEGDARNFGSHSTDPCKPGDRIVYPRSAPTTSPSAGSKGNAHTCDPSNPGRFVPGPLRGDLSWAGGRLPQGVSSVTYAFPDGHRTNAVTDNGYWVIQDLAPYWANNLNGLHVTVHLDGPGGPRRVDVPLGINTVCNQQNHGC